MLIAAAFLEGFLRQTIQDPLWRIAIGWGVGALWVAWLTLSGRNRTPSKETGAMSLIFRDGKRVEELMPPEGVALHLDIASVASRLGAQFIDFVMTFVIALICIIVLSLSGALEESARATAITLLGFLLRTPYYILSELIWNGRTLGKRIAGIRVVNVEGRRLTPHQIATRNLMKEVEIFTPLGLIFSQSPVLADMDNPFLARHRGGRHFIQQSAATARRSHGWDPRH